MTVLRCTGCGGAVVESRYEDRLPTTEGVVSKTKFYNCPLCGPGIQHGPDDRSGDDFVAAALSAALVSQTLDGES